MYRSYQVRTNAYEPKQIPVQLHGDDSGGFSGTISDSFSWV